MSFGFSVGDFILLTQIAHKTFRNCQEAGDEYAEIANAVRCLHSVLRTLRVEAQRRDSKIFKQNPKAIAQLVDTADGCKTVLDSLDYILTKYEGLKVDSGAGAGRKLWQRFRFGSKTEELIIIRGKIINYTSTLSILIDTLHIQATDRIETKIDGNFAELNGKFEMIRKEIFAIAAQARVEERKGSTISTLSLSTYAGDEKIVWRDFRRELVRKGFRSQSLEKNKQILLAYMVKLDQSGLLDQTEKSTINPIGENQWWSKKMFTDTMNSFADLQLTEHSPSGEGLSKGLVEKLDFMPTVAEDDETEKTDSPGDIKPTDTDVSPVEIEIVPAAPISNHKNSGGIVGGGRSQFAALDAIDINWRETWGEDLKHMGITDDLIRDNQDFVADYIKQQQAANNELPEAMTLSRKGSIEDADLVSLRTTYSYKSQRSDPVLARPELPAATESEGSIDVDKVHRRISLSGPKDSWSSLASNRDKEDTKLQPSVQEEGEEKTLYQIDSNHKLVPSNTIDDSTLVGEESQELLLPELATTAAEPLRGESPTEVPVAKNVKLSKENVGLNQDHVASTHDFIQGSKNGAQKSVHSRDLRRHTRSISTDQRINKGVERQQGDSSKLRESNRDAEMQDRKQEPREKLEPRRKRLEARNAAKGTKSRKTRRPEFFFGDAKPERNSQAVREDHGSESKLERKLFGETSHTSAGRKPWYQRATDDDWISNVDEIVEIDELPPAQQYKERPRRKINNRRRPRSMVVEERFGSEDEVVVVEEHSPPPRRASKRQERIVVEERRIPRSPISDSEEVVILEESSPPRRAQADYGKASSSMNRPKLFDMRGESAVKSTFLASETPQILERVEKSNRTSSRRKVIKDST